MTCFLLQSIFTMPSTYFVETIFINWEEIPLMLIKLMKMKVEVPNIFEDRNLKLVASFEVICLIGYCWHQVNSRFMHEIWTIFELLVSFNWTKLVENIHIIFFINFQGCFFFRNNTLAFKNILLALFYCSIDLFNAVAILYLETKDSFVFAYLASLSSVLLGG